MILSKANLLAINITEKGGDTRLQTLHVAKDGSTIAANSRTLIAVSPVEKGVRENLTFLKGSEHDEAGTITAETVKSVLKYMPKDLLYKGLLEHCSFEEGKFSIHDGKRTQRVEAKLFDREYINYKEAFEKIGKAKVKNRIVINLKTLLTTLQVIDKIAQNTTNDNPIYIDITEDGHLVLRSLNYRTNQRVIAFTSAYKQEETKWMAWNLWERRLLGKLKGLTNRLLKRKR